MTLGQEVGAIIVGGVCYCAWIHFSSYISKGKAWGPYLALFPLLVVGVLLLIGVIQ